MGGRDDLIIYFEQDALAGNIHEYKINICSKEFVGIDKKDIETGEWKAKLDEIRDIYKLNASMFIVNAQDAIETYQEAIEKVKKLL